MMAVSTQRSKTGFAQKTFSRQTRSAAIFTPERTDQPWQNVIKDTFAKSVEKKSKGSLKAIFTSVT
jgi:hypothetical protein